MHIQSIRPGLTSPGMLTYLPLRSKVDLPLGLQVAVSSSTFTLPHPRILPGEHLSPWGWGQSLLDALPGHPVHQDTVGDADVSLAPGMGTTKEVASVSKERARRVCGTGVTIPSLGHLSLVTTLSFLLGREQKKNSRIHNSQETFLIRFGHRAVGLSWYFPQVFFFFLDTHMSPPSEHSKMFPFVLFSLKLQVLFLAGKNQSIPGKSKVHSLRAPVPGKATGISLDFHGSLWEEREATRAFRGVLPRRSGCELIGVCDESMWLLVWQTVVFVLCLQREGSVISGVSSSEDM